MRLVRERQRTSEGESLRSSLGHVGEMTGISPDTIRGWLSRARVDAN